MDKPFTLDPAGEETPEEIAAIKAEINQCMAEWEQIKRELQNDRRDIERLKTDTRIMLDNLQAKRRQRSVARFGF